MDIPKPIFEDKVKDISWKKIYAREYGVQYSEMAILCLSDKAKHHIPTTSHFQVVIPEDSNTAFYIDDISWVKLVESLNKRYTSDVKQLEEYEKQFIHDGETYLHTALRIARMDLKNLSNKEIKNLYLDYQGTLFNYSVFTWTSFILNNYVAERATAILDIYIQKSKSNNDRQFFLDSLFKPQKKAAILELQDEVGRYRGRLSNTLFENLYRKYRWLSCLDIHNKPWTREEFRKHVRLFSQTIKKSTLTLSTVAEELKIKSTDLDYLSMAQRFVYIKDARDDYRRQGVYHALVFFKELAKRMGIEPEEISYLQHAEVVAFLDEKIKISKRLVSNRKKGFVLYLDKNKMPVCVTGSDIAIALKRFNLLFTEEKTREIRGSVASRGIASGKVVIVRGVKDLHKVQKGDVLVAVTTHPDYVPAMRKSVAIVTDEGGITSHAAIVSREFGIPCIVGTKYSTSILKDGDVVEVNAVDGLVKLMIY